MFEIFGPIFEQNATINFEPIFEKNANCGPIFEKSVNFEHFVNGKWTHYYISQYWHHEREIKVQLNPDLFCPLYGIHLMKVLEWDFKIRRCPYNFINARLSLILAKVFLKLDFPFPNKP